CWVPLKTNDCSPGLAQTWAVAVQVRVCVFLRLWLALLFSTETSVCVSASSQETHALKSCSPASSGSLPAEHWCVCVCVCVSAYMHACACVYMCVWVYM